MVIRVATSSPETSSKSGRSAVGRKALFVVFLTSLLLLHVTPRPARPYLFPFPAVDGELLRRASDESRRLAASVDERPLAHEARLVGELVRRFRVRGVDLEGGLDPAAEVARLRGQGFDGELGRLRALQSELFVREVRKFAATRTVTTDLRELGGDFAEVASSGWLDDGAGLLLSEDELRLLFRLRWSKLTGLLDDPHLGPSPAELRAYQALLLQRPPGAALLDPASLAAARLRPTLEYGSLDPDYPVDLARGLLELEMGHADLAERSFLDERNSARSSARRLRVAHHLREARRRLLAEF